MVVTISYFYVKLCVIFFILILICSLLLHLYKGKPEAPYDVHEASASSRAIVVSFVPGLDGGYTQTITAHYRRSGDAI